MIDELREKIDLIDDKIVDLIDQRLSLSKKIGLIKRENGYPINDEGREKQIINRLSTGKTSEQIEQIKRIYEIIFYLSKEIQK